MLKPSDDPTATEDWKGLRELDRAITENRVTAYTWKKTWADPWARAKMITAFALLGAFIASVFIDDLILRRLPFLYLVGGLFRCSLGPLASCIELASRLLYQTASPFHRCPSLFPYPRWTRTSPNISFP